MPKRKLSLAGRKWRRQFNDAVLQSIAKTVTEPITNSYDSYKRIFGTEDASTGLVAAMLAVPTGTHFVHENIIHSLPKRNDREISVRLSRTDRANLAKRECIIADSAEGMSAAELTDKFAKYGSEKSGASAGQAVRGLFGQGICDVVYSHPPGRIATIKNEQAAECLFTWSDGHDEVPEYEIIERGKTTKALRDVWGLTRGNGTSVSFLLSEKCRLPGTDEALIARLSNFYMLRLINSDPATTVRLSQIRSDATNTSSLQYFFPRGQALKHFKTAMQYESFPPITIEGIVIRSESPLPGRDEEDDRANGLLLVDEFDSVYDQTFFGYDSSPYLDHIYGVVRITGIRQVLRSKLESGEALLTESRDGFDRKKSLYRDLEKAIIPQIDAVLKKEIEKRSEPENVLSKSVEKKLKRAFEKLNDLFEDLTKESSPGVGDGSKALRLPESMEFEDQRVQLRVGVKRRVRLLANAALIRADSIVVMDSDSAHVRIEPTSSSWVADQRTEGMLVVSAILTADRVGDAASIVALAQGVDGSTVEATLTITDVAAALAIEAPSAGIEFNPQLSTAAPSRRGQLALLVDPNKVPLGTEIQITRTSGDAAVMLIGQDEVDTTRLTIPFSKEHLLPGGTVGRIGIGYRGYGFGQKAEFSADCFVGNENLRAQVLVKIQQSTSPSGGTFKDVQYGDLPGRMGKSSSEFDPTTGVITINRLHPINRAAFGADKTQFANATESDPRAQWRFAEVIIDQCLYHTAAVAYQNSQLIINTDDVVSAFRRWIEQFKHDHAELVFRELVPGFKVPKLTAPKPSGDTTSAGTTEATS